MSGVEVITEEVPTTTLDLVVTEKSIGSLETNISQLEAMVDKRLEDYRPEKYQGDADLAKKDKAELNKASETIRKSRIALMEELMKPYQDFETRCKNLESKIKSASNALDEIVKIRDNEAKEQKRKTIELFWQTKKFDLFPLEKVFNPKWLNKTFKESEIIKEMDSIIARTYQDLKSIEQLENADTLKAHYLMTLNIGDTLKYGEELKRQKEVAEREARERAEREHSEKIERQQSELAKEAIDFGKKEEIASLADQALSSIRGEKPKAPQRNEYIITVRCFESDVMKMKAAMNALGIEYSVKELTF
ncbi:Protein of unknown function [Treponema bryantii]|uniref:DUF1351 domain-containing protein n=1 Tax=Treponema bryantii TaxID=163 RepID=A0A1H9B4A6_9SPIR|nr:DUF1351 domain-containing protein [Treponema bryantii]SEP83551.1 Protein of unknown function [Treponema bryantii]